MVWDGLGLSGLVLVTVSVLGVGVRDGEGRIARREGKDDDGWVGRTV